MVRRTVFGHDLDGRSDDAGFAAGLDRRAFLRLSAAAAASAVLARAGFAAEAPAGSPGAFPLARFPEKTDLILLTDRPPNLETPLKYFRTDLTPNDAFFVRWHLGIVPTRVDAGAFELSVAGHVNTELSLSMEDLKKDFEPVSVVAVNQCSGNSRGFFAPRVTGGQWGHGAMGNAKWTGVRLKDLLAKAGVKPGAVEVTFKGLDKSPAPTVPDFVKSLSVDKSNDPDVIVAYAMNDKPLPMLNGFPLRLVVPGWFATYWVKALSEIRVLNEPFTGFWMAKAYRVSKRPLMDETPDALATDTVPISRMVVRSLIVRPEANESVKAGQAYEVDGIAFDGGSGIKQVEVSTDGGKTWTAATLGEDHGKYSFRRWTLAWTPAAAGDFTILARATNHDGDTQPAEPKWNRSGYARNVIESVRCFAT